MSMMWMTRMVTTRMTTATATTGRWSDTATGVVVVVRCVMTRRYVGSTIDAAPAHASSAIVTIVAAVAVAIHPSVCAAAAAMVMASRISVDAVTGADRIQGQSIGGQAGRRTADRRRGRSRRIHNVVAHHRVPVHWVLVLHEVVHLAEGNRVGDIGQL